MGNFLVGYASRVVIYDCKDVIRLATVANLIKALVIVNCDPKVVKGTYMEASSQ